MGANTLGATVLVADDEDDLRFVAREILEAHGYQVIEAANGREAVELYLANIDRIDLILLDLTMPEMSGKEALVKIRKADGSVPVIIASGYNKESIAEQFREEKVEDFIHKPFHMAELLTKIASALE
jgi:two-component system cell cycle sensor histidine kinase/response regulator CckA